MENNNSSLTRPSAVAAYPRSWSWQRRESRTGRRRGRRWRSWRVEWIVPVDLPLLSRYFSCSHPLLISVSVPTLLQHLYDSPSPVTYLPRWILGKEGGSWLFIVLIAHHRHGGEKRWERNPRRSQLEDSELHYWLLEQDSLLVKADEEDLRVSLTCKRQWDVSCSPLHRLFFFFCNICSGVLC